MTDRIVKVVLRGEVAGFIGSMRASSAAVKSTVNSMADGSKEAGKFRQNLSTIGKSAGAIGLVAAAGVAVAVRAFANFDEAMSHVAATGADAKGSIDALREAALKAGARTQYSATEAAGAIEELAKAGVSASDILGGALNGSLDLAAAGGLAVADAASIAATTLNQFGLSGDKASHVADILASTANSAQGSVSDVGEAMKYVGPVAAQMGVSLEETAGTIGELASQGILAGNAGTALRGMLSALTSPSKIAASTMADLGMNMYDAQGEFIGFKGVAQQLHTTLGGLSNAERDQALGRIFGNEQITAARILYKGGAKDVEAWTKAVDQDGAAAEQAATRMDNLKGDLEQLKGSLETAFIGTGGGADGPLRALTQDITGLVNAYNSLPAPVKSAVLGVGAVTAALGLSVFAASKALTAYSSLRLSMASLGISGTKAATAIKGIGIAAAAFAAVDIGASIGDSFDTRNSKDIDKMAGSLKRLAATGKASGDLGDLFGSDLHGKSVRFGKDLGGIGEAIKSLPGYKDDGSLTETLKFFGSAGQSAGIVKQAEGLQDLDKAFSSLLADDPSSAISAFEHLRDKALETGASAKDVAAAFPTMTEAMRSASLQAGGTGDAAKVLAGDMSKLGPASQAAAAAQKAQADATRKQAGAFIDVSHNVNNAKVSLHSWIKDLAKQADALNHFADNAVKAGKRGLEDGLIQDLQNAGPEGARRMKQLANASDTELARANHAWRKGQKAIDAYIERFGHVPGDVSTNVNVNTGDALRKLWGIQQAIKNIHGKTVGIHVTSSHGGGTTTKDADGSIHLGGGRRMVAFANGTENHVAQIGTGDYARVWNEPETEGEAYIPLALSKRRRSQQIAMETVSRLGGAAYFANGGISGGSSSSSGPATAVLRDNRVHIGGDGLARLIDSRVDLVYAANSSHDRK